MAIIPQHGLLTVEDYYRLVEEGLLSEYDRVELIEGRIVEMAPIGDDHVAATVDLNDLFSDRFRGRASEGVQNPINLARRSEPEPDFAIVRHVPGGRRKAKTRKSTPAEIFLIVEIANSSLAFDLGEKADMYAHYEIQELWMVDIPHDQLVVHREPTADGFASVLSLTRGEGITPLAFLTSASQPTRYSASLSAVH
jgi:Uma2 family endonuclease